MGLGNDVSTFEIETQMEEKLGVQDVAETLSCLYHFLVLPSYDGVGASSR